MKFLSLIVASLLFTGAAQAGSTNCVGNRLAYYADYTDGGAPRDPIIGLVVDGRVLIKTGMFEPNPVMDAGIEFTGEPRVIKTEFPDPEHEVTYFEQNARVFQWDTEHVFFSGEVLCKNVRYVGPPRP